jgi:hypothetical protein
MAERAESLPSWQGHVIGSRIPRGWYECETISRNQPADSTVENGRRVAAFGYVCARSHGSSLSRY